MSHIRSIQAPAAVVMIRPHKFTPNAETAADNAFQQAVAPEQAQSIAEAAYREVIELSQAQIAEFAGNAIELSGRDGRLLALSQRACDSLSAGQKTRIGRSARLAPLAVPTIEMAGGSVRCMIAGIHLSPRQ